MIDRGLEILPVKSREVFKLYRFQHLAISQIALQMELSEKAVEYHLTKATKSIRVYLKEILISGLVMAIAFLR